MRGTPLLLTCILCLLAAAEARKKPKPKWVVRKGSTLLEAAGKHPAFECTYSVKYKKKSGWVDWKKSQLRCKKVASPVTTAPPSAQQCQVADPDLADSMPEWPALLVDSAGGLLVANTTASGGREVTLGLGDTATLYCPKKDFENYPAATEMTLRCGNDAALVVTADAAAGVPEWTAADFTALGCAAQYRETFQHTGISCGPAGMEGELVQVGFLTSSSVGYPFQWMFTSCHQASRAHNLYVEHTVAAGIAAQDKNNDRPGFGKDGFYSGYDIDGMYTKTSQEAVVGTLVGSTTLAEEYFPGGSVYIARGHLAPNADFLTYAWQDATFTFIDVAPQWQSFNAGNWLDVENGLRDLAEQVGELRVWTGTHGVLQLPHSNGTMVDIYLDEDGQEKVPVPRFFWKVIAHEASRRAIAVVGANNPHRAETPPCQAIQGEVPWLRFVNTESLEAGPLTACSVDGFELVVPEFPGTVLDTSGGLLL